MGFEDDSEKLIHLLTRGMENLDIISIVGMPGLGKTTLVTKYSKILLSFCSFDIRAWCTISQSQSYNPRELLTDIFGEVTDVKHHVHLSDDIADILRKCLIGKRYLIVLDERHGIS